MKNEEKIIKKIPHKNIILGRKKEEGFFNSKEKKWILNQYPLLISGSTGAGKSEALLSMASQYIENNEGVIYFDGKGDNIYYTKMFSYAEKYNRLNDFYILNFMTGSVLPIKEDSIEEKLSHTIDPINPMVGDDEYFNLYFGKMGQVIHAILKKLHEKEQLMDIQSLESILMLNNLLVWYKEDKFNTEEIAKYILELGLSIEEDNDEEDFNNALLQHAHNAHTAYETVQLLKRYSYIFKLDCSVNMENIFLERKILLVMLPALERSTIQISNLGSLITSQIKYIEKKYAQYQMHLQNIIIDEFAYFTDVLTTVDLDNTKNNYVFGCMDYYNNNHIFNYVMSNKKTHVMMKSHDAEIHNKIKEELINNINKLPTLKNVINKNASFVVNFSKKINDFNEVQAYVLCKNIESTNNANIINSEYKYYCELIECEYLPSKYVKKIWLVQQPRRKIIVNK